MNSKRPKKIALVTHEFGLMRNSGGIAGYLYTYTKKYLKYDPDVEIYVITCNYHKRSDLLEHRRVHIFQIEKKKLSERGKEVLQYILEIRPDIVEVTDYLGLCLEALVYKHIVGVELNNTVFLQYCHTATKEIYDWGGFGDVNKAPARVKVPINRELSQTILVDKVMAPSNFLRSYISDHYGIVTPEKVTYALDVDPYDRNELKKEMHLNYQLECMNDRFVINYITRFEDRKNQRMLVSVFLRFLKEIDDNAILILVGNSMESIKTGKNLMLEIYSDIPDEFKENIRFFEFATLEERKKYFSVSDLTVMTSPYENFPLLMVDSVRYGVPIMTSVYCGCCDYMGKYKDNMSFDPFDDNDLFEKMVSFYKCDQFDREDIISVERNELVNLCSLENSLVKKIELYCEVLERNDGKDVDGSGTFFINYVEDRRIEVTDGSNVVFIPNDKLHIDPRTLEKIIRVISLQPEGYAVSMGKDCLHTDCFDAWQEGYPILFTHMKQASGRMKDILKTIMEERKDHYFSIPMEAVFDGEEQEP